mgnify:FL=1
MRKNNKDIQVFVIHVRGQEERKQYIEAQLKTLGYPYEYILDGNMEDLTPEILDNYFVDNRQDDTMFGIYPRTSCAYKAFLAYKKIIDKNLEGALIFEDDIQLFQNFRPQFEKTLDEIEKYHQNTPLIVNYEESSLLLVPRSMRKRGRYLYKMPRDRFAGCYYINNKAAHVITDYVEKYKCDKPLDRFHTDIVRQNLISYYWSHTFFLSFLPYFWNLRFYLSF